MSITQENLENWLNELLKLPEKIEDIPEYSLDLSIKLSAFKIDEGIIKQSEILGNNKKVLPYTYWRNLMYYIICDVVPATYDQMKFNDAKKILIDFINKFHKNDKKDLINKSNENDIKSIIQIALISGAYAIKHYQLLHDVNKKQINKYIQKVLSEFVDNEMLASNMTHSINIEYIKYKVMGYRYDIKGMPSPEQQIMEVIYSICLMLVLKYFVNGIIDYNNMHYV